ncbi:MAG: hypothetical protein COA63_014320 [Methylophaga sp.]|nr:hypothetical protein [Methylophaga sp.]
MSDNHLILNEIICDLNSIDNIVQQNNISLSLLREKLFGEDENDSLPNIENKFSTDNGDIDFIKHHIDSINYHLTYQTKLIKMLQEL